MCKKFAETYALNVMGHVNGLAPVVEKFKSRGFGHVMMVASVSGYSGLPTAAAYGASKAAVINMCEALKFDFDAMNIRIQVVNPGFIETPLTDKNEFAMPALMPVEKAVQRIIAGISLGGFELTFPRRFTWLVKFMRLLPYCAVFSADEENDRRGQELSQPAASILRRVAACSSRLIGKFHIRRDGRQFQHDRRPGIERGKREKRDGEAASAAFGSKPAYCKIGKTSPTPSASDILVERLQAAK